MRGGTAQDDDYLYLIMEYLPGGDVMVRHIGSHQLGYTCEVHLLVPLSRPILLAISHLEIGSLANSE